MKNIACLALSLTLASCSSNKPMNEDATGSGYTDTRLEDGLYRVTVRGAGGILDSTEGLDKTWRSRAAVLCAATGYTIIERSETAILKSELSAESMLVIGVAAVASGGLFVPIAGGTATPTLDGFVLCDNSKLTIDDAKLLLHEEGLLIIPRTLEIAPNTCSLTLESSSGQELVAHGKLALETGSYEEALACLHLAATDGWSISEGDPEAQYLVGNIYENGLGVDVDKLRARQWYRRAALNGSEQARLRLEQQVNTDASGTDHD